MLCTSTNPTVTACPHPPFMIPCSTNKRTELPKYLLLAFFYDMKKLTKATNVTYFDVIFTVFISSEFKYFLIYLKLQFFGGCAKIIRGTC